MAKIDNPSKSNAIAKASIEAAIANPAISDFRKERQTFKVLSECLKESGGDLLPDHVGPIAGAGLLDYLGGLINETEAAVVVKYMEKTLEKDDNDLRWEEHAFQIERLGMRAEKRTERKSRLRVA